MLEKLAGPVIGALIGYCTNYIAVKMLFYPKKEVRIGGHKLPFTPGAIPKGKPRLAKAVGTIVAKDLLTEEDIRQKMVSPEVEKNVVDQIMAGLSKDIHSGISSLCSSKDAYETVKQKIVAELSDQILDSVHHMNLEEIIVQEAGNVVKEKTKGSMLEMFLNDDMVTSLIRPIGGKIVAYIDEKGPEYIERELTEKVDLLEEKSVLDICRSFELSEENIRGIVTKFYHQAVGSFMEKLLGNLDVSSIIEEKINAMDVDSLEEMVMTVMKKELDTIVNLGALVGAVLGVFNLLF